MQLKAGEPIDQNMITAQGKLFNIPESYWQYIVRNLFEDGYIEGAALKPWGSKEIIVLEECMITPKGIEYICDNSVFEKVKSFLKDIKEVTPFI